MQIIFPGSLIIQGLLVASPPEVGYLKLFFFQSHDDKKTPAMSDRSITP